MSNVVISDPSAQSRATKLGPRGATCTYSGAGVPYTPQSTDDTIKGVCHSLLAQHHGSPSRDLARLNNFKRVVWTKDPVLLGALRTELEHALTQALQSNEEVLIPFIHNVLALLPYTYPSEGDTFKIPVKKANGWVMTEYRVDKKIDLTPAWFSTPVPALGLVSEGENPILSCMGTTYPAGDGFIASVLSDFTPGFSVGHAATLWGKKELGEWLNGKQNVTVTGCSLGGAISLHVARLFGSKVAHVYAFNPAGHYPWNWSDVNHSDTLFHIYSQENDLVSTMGVFPKGDNVEFYRVLTEKEEASGLAHTKVYSAAPNVTFIKSDAAFENQRAERKFLTALHMTLGPLLFLILLPFQFLHRFAQLMFTRGLI